MYIFGGYDGSNRVNDFYEFSLEHARWSLVPASGIPPSPRDRHIGVTHGNSFYVFAGFDGTQRVNDFFEFSFDTHQWVPVAALSGIAPTPRHSHAAVIHGHSMFVFGGYDGSYRSDFHEFNFVSCTWNPVTATGRVPRARYRATVVTHAQCMYLFGGHDGTRHLNDVHVFDFGSRIWMTLQCEGTPPIPRDSHVSVVHGKSMYIFGGSTGSAMNDFHELRLDTCKWSSVQAVGSAPGHRFCHVAVVHKGAMYVFGGYDGTNRLNDLLEFRFGVDLTWCDIPEGSLVSDLREFVNQEELSDVTFIVEGRPVYAKILCMRCTYFKAMFMGEMKESREREITLQDVRYPIFLALLEYLYTDEVNVSLDIAMELLQAADQFGVERLKKMCESKMLASISIENAASIFHAADLHNAKSLREKCLNFILSNFDAVTKTSCFEEMGRTNIELVFEILRQR
eukprot:CAMPEP_0117818270 /NCGR_PEP_ID=MMETSP0949-20121206/1148_1 /TAXON_ID=44440 /ORGANISM="Chattonella subsalsa, Strain CCMP2191" /LENGTH=452 /DNA_ID=CAMNT_0005656753 /DNA_START=128 /DNA_END=1486 /DNA_ORIENTATION=+